MSAERVIMSFFWGGGIAVSPAQLSGASGAHGNLGETFRKWKAEALDRVLQLAVEGK